MVSNHRKTIADSEIQSFWEWFEAIAPELGRNLDNQVILDELDRRVSALADVAWEVGPGLQEENALVITPDGVRRQLTTTQDIVARAPRVPDWEFHWARPPRRWNLEFSIDADSGVTIHVDARSWRYVLLRFPDQTFDIVLEQSNLGEVSEGDRYTAAVVLLDGILGERKRLEFIGGIQPVAALSGEQNSKANSIEFLSRHLESIVARQ